MKHSSKALKAAAKTLRAARDLMNNNGMHWIKGAEKMWVDPETHVPGDYGDFSVVFKTGQIEPAYCSIGALKEVSADVLAIVALADLVAPEEMARHRERLREEAETEREYGYIVTDEDEYVESGLLQDALDAIVEFNDDDDRTWGEVRAAFTKAAKRLADRAARAS